MNTERKLYSIKRIFFTSFSLIFAITFVLLVLYASLAYSFMTRQTAETIESALHMYRNTLEKEMDEITSYQDKLIYNDSNFMMLTVSNLSSLERIIIEQNTRKLQFLPFDNFLTAPPPTEAKTPRARHRSRTLSSSTRPS